VNGTAPAVHQAHVGQPNGVDHPVGQGQVGDAMGALFVLQKPEHLAFRNCYLFFNIYYYYFTFLNCLFYILIIF
jgi:hypothetical protein